MFAVAGTKTAVLLWLLWIQLWQGGAETCGDSVTVAPFGAS